MEEKPRPGAFEQAARELDAEVQRILEIIETRVVPRARRDGEKVLRRISEELNRWADHLQDQPAGASPAGESSPEGESRPPGVSPESSPGPPPSPAEEDRK